jgi:hypothetical protein
VQDHELPVHWHVLQPSPAGQNVVEEQPGLGAHPPPLLLPLEPPPLPLLVPPPLPLPLPPLLGAPLLAPPPPGLPVSVFPPHAATTKAPAGRSKARGKSTRGRRIAGRAERKAYQGRIAPGPRKSRARNAGW